MTITSCTTDRRLNDTRMFTFFFVVPTALIRCTNKEVSHCVGYLTYETALDSLVTFFLEKKKIPLLEKVKNTFDSEEEMKHEKF